VPDNEAEKTSVGSNQTPGEDLIPLADNDLTVEDMMPARKKAPRKKTPGNKWSARVTKTSDALTLQKSVFKKSPHAIALSLKRSAERSHRRKSAPFRSAMSMLNFYINRAGKNLTASERAKLEAAKEALRKVFHREDAA
jgi:hypothetical protein